MECEAYKQFEGMSIPSDIKPSPVLNKKEIEKHVKRGIQLVGKNLVISLNTIQFRANEVHIHTADIGAHYHPDYDFTDLEEFDAWRKTCKLKFWLQQFENVDLVRCEGFFHRMQICETLTLFEEVNRMLKDEDGKFLIEVLDLYKLIQELGTNQPTIKRLQNYESLIFSAGDSTGLYYNRTIWTFERLKMYLEMAKFSKIEKIEKENSNNISIMAYK